MTSPFKSIIAEKVVEDFLSALEAKDISPEIIEKLRKTLLEDGQMSETLLCEALIHSDSDD